MTPGENMKTKKSWLNNKTVLISGASSGIGKELSKVLITRYECKVIGLARREDRLKLMKDELGSSFDYVQLDVCEEGAWVGLQQQLKLKGIDVDILINNAGVIHEFELFDNINNSTIDNVMKTNFQAMIQSTKTFLPDIIAARGGILNISSAAGLTPIPGMSVYCASKAAIYSLTLALSYEVPKDIYVGVVCPGFIETELFDAKNGNAEIIKSRDKRLVNHFSMRADKAAKKIAKALHRRRRRRVLGIDAKLLSAITRISPKAGTRMMRRIMKISRLSSFQNIFDNKKDRI